MFVKCMNGYLSGFFSHPKADSRGPSLRQPLQASLFPSPHYPHEAAAQRATRLGEVLELRSGSKIKDVVVIGEAASLGWLKQETVMSSGEQAGNEAGQGLIHVGGGSNMYRRQSAMGEDVVPASWC